MSSLYETPSERAQRLSKSTETGNFFQDTFTGAVSAGISLGEDGRVNREGLAWWMQGLTPGARSIAEQKKGLEDSRIIQRQVQASGLTDAQLKEELGDSKLTVGNVSGTIAERQRKRAEQLTPAQQSQVTRGENADKLANTNAANANTIAQGNLELSRTTAANNMTLAANQMEMARLDNKFDRETASADRNLTLQLGQMNAELEDKRMAYDRETRSMDKRDRMIAQLMSGLGSLGGAFAL